MSWDMLKALEDWVDKVRDVLWGATVQDSDKKRNIEHNRSFNKLRDDDKNANKNSLVSLDKERSSIADPD